LEQRQRDHWGNPGIDGRIILRWIFRKWDVGVWTGLGWLRIVRWRALVNAVTNILPKLFKFCKLYKYTIFINFTY
jgi:hypothetical protein